MSTNHYSVTPYGDTTQENLLGRRPVADDLKVGGYLVIPPQRGRAARNIFANSRERTQTIDSLTDSYIEPPWLGRSLEGPGHSYHIMPGRWVL